MQQEYKKMTTSEFLVKVLSFYYALLFTQKKSPYFFVSLPNTPLTNNQTIQKVWTSSSLCFFSHLPLRKTQITYHFCQKIKR